MGYALKKNTTLGHGLSRLTSSSSGSLVAQTRHDVKLGIQPHLVS